MKIVYLLVVANAICYVFSSPQLDDSEKSLVKLLNKIDKVDSLPLFGGLRIDRVQSDNGRRFTSVNNMESLEAKAEQYLSTHELNFSIPNEEQEEEFNGRSMTGKAKLKEFLKSPHNFH